MRSPIVWICFAIVILCALSAESAVRRSYHVVHGRSGPMLRSVVSTGHKNSGRKVVAKRVQQQEEEYNEDEEEGEEDEEDDEVEPDYTYGYPVAGGSPYPYPPYEDEEEDDEEEEDEDEEEEQDAEVGRRNEIEGRQAYINNNYVDEPYVLRQARPQNNNRAPIRNNNRPVAGNVNRPMNKPQNNNINRRPNPQQPRPGFNGQQNNRVQQGNMPNRVVRPPPPRQQFNNNNQKLQLRPVASSTQFIATPVADLILRLSISLAKPVGNGGNGGNMNKPVRIQHDDVKNVEEKNVLDLALNRVDHDMSKLDSTPIKSGSGDKHVDDGDDKQQDPSVNVTELPRK